MALRPLGQLEILHIGILLSDEILIAHHALHERDSKRFVNILDCLLCDFDKICMETKEREEAASAVMRCSMKRLRTITWASAFERHELD